MQFFVTAKVRLRRPNRMFVEGLRYRYSLGSIMFLIGGCFLRVRGLELGALIGLQIGGG